LSEQETHILKCLGAAVLLRWNDLPTHIQRELFEHSVVDVEPREIAMLKDQIARFLHKHKDDSRHRKWPAMPSLSVVKVRSHDW
jgi:hypothetical protein